ETPRVDTVSYFNDSEPDWNERPYFTRVEQRRGRAGTHIDVSECPSLPSPYDPCYFSPIPGNTRNMAKSAQQFRDCLLSKNHRVVLSGIGGDEFLGGVATSLPELANAFASGRWHTLLKQSIAWAFADRRPLVYLLCDTVRSFLPSFSVRSGEVAPSWIDR